MATITFIKTSNGYIAKVTKTITSATTKLIQSFATRHNLDVQSINIVEDEPLFPTSWEQYVLANETVKPQEFKIRMY